MATYNPKAGWGWDIDPETGRALSHSGPALGWPGAQTGSTRFSGIEPYSAQTKPHVDERRPFNLYGGAPEQTSSGGSLSSGSRSYGGGGSSRPIPYGSETTWQPSGDMPTMGELPEYMTPEMDRARISELTELGMGAPMGRLKEGLNRALLEARYSDNPNVRGMARKEALSGYGAGITDVRTGAHREAMSEYLPEFQAQVGKTQTEYQARMQRIRDQFQGNMQSYLAGGTKTTTPIEGRRTGAFGPASWEPQSNELGQSSLSRLGGRNASWGYLPANVGRY